VLKRYALNIVKAAAVMFTVGLVLAYSAPILASAAGLSLGAIGSAAHPLWTGLYFGAFGAISAAATPIIGKAVDTISGWFSKKPDANSFSTELKINPGPVVMAEAKHHGMDAGTQFQDMVTASKKAAATIIHSGP
jgi:hypothetical protein